MVKKFDNIHFVSTVDGLEEIQECCPSPANKYIPEWWKKLPKPNRHPATQTVKVCPSFPDFFSQGYVVPMWADTVIRYDQESDKFNWLAGRPGPDNPFNVEVHGHDQFTDHVTPSFLGVSSNLIFRFDCPWRLITPKGYSVLQLPLFYHFDSQFSVMPGIIDTDSHHHINQQILYHGKGKEVFIKRGTPIAQYIPFKRERFNLLIRSQTKEDGRRFNKGQNIINTLFPGRHSYRTDL